jgi:hypothetical protein
VALVALVALAVVVALVVTALPVCLAAIPP